VTLPGQMTEVVVHAIARRYPHVHLHVVLELRAPYPREALVDALASTIADFPVLAARYVPGWWRDRWVSTGIGADELVETATVEGPVEERIAAHVGRTFDHQTEPSVRLLQVEGAGETRLVISVHHMVSDGAGCLTLANVLGAHLCGGEPRAPVGAARSHLAVLRGLRTRDLPLLALEVIREGIQPWSILRVRRRDREFPQVDGPAAPAWHTVRLTGEAAERFAGWCRAHGATINDGLVAAMTRLSAARTAAGPVAAAYTIDTRRYLARPRSLISNLVGVSMVVLPRATVSSALEALRAVSARIGVQKRRLPGLAYNVLPSLSFGWMPHGIIRRVGDRAIHTILGYQARALAVTNIGAMDGYLAPFGDRVVAASVLGPFIRGAPAPVVVATGFGGGLTLHVCAGGQFEAGTLAEFASELQGVLTDLNDGTEGTR
jgi:NRPS condensation-like uncharacterized protein